jgi:predicted esterase
MRLRIAVTFLVALCAPFSAVTAPTTTVTDVPTARGTIRIAHYRPDVPLANLYVMSGGDGVLRLQQDGTGFGDNFAFSPVMRNRQALLDAGYSIVMIDAPSDMQASPGIPFPHRVTGEHAAELLEVLRTVQQRDNVPAWMLGFSAGGPSVANLAINAPRSAPFGLVLLSPNTGFAQHLLTLNLDAIQRPVLLLTHELDSCDGTSPANAPVVMSRLSATEARRHASFTGGSFGSRGGGCDSTGYHGLGGNNTRFMAELTDWMRANASLTQAVNYQGLWWRSPAGSESGWGVNLTHQGETLFATWFTYDTDGSPMWLVMSSGARTAEGVYRGELYRTTGPAFSTTPWSGSVIAMDVGMATFTFTDSSNGTFAYEVNGVSQSKPITRQSFASPAPACIAGAVHTATPNFQALWWASPPGSESGWGVNIAHQGDTLFATWFTYAAGGRGQWLVMSNGARTAANTYSGDLYRTTGPAFNATPWGAVSVTRAGTGTFTFTGAESGTFAYNVDGVSQSKAIVRQSFAAPATVCR